MEIQNRLFDYDEDLKFENIKILDMKPNPKSLEKEKENFIKTMSNFIDQINFEENQCNGRPRFSVRDIIKSLLVMSYNGMSYRRTECDLKDLKEKGIINYVPSKSLLNKYMLLDETKKIMEKMIQTSSLFFVDYSHTLIVDSTWLSPRMYSGGYRRVYNKKDAPLQKLRKLHISCLKDSKIICCAKVTPGTIHDSTMFKELVHIPIKNGFNIDCILGDAGYSGKENYAFCEAINIKNIFIDFKSNNTLRRAKSIAWKRQLTMFKENPEIWHESYRFRVLVEQIFSSIKRKHTNYLRSRKDNSQDIELLLKCLVYNFCIIGKFMD